MEKILSALKRAIKGANTALIVSHIDPDGDSIGSMLALGAILTQLGVYPDYYSQDGIPKIYRFLPDADKVKSKLISGYQCDLLFAMDASDLKRLGDKIAARDICKVLINIDHHPDNTRYGDINYVEKSSSTAELVYKLAKGLKVKIDREIAENLYIALITDTGNFRYENTSVATFNMAGDLLGLGVDTHEITTRIYDTKSIASIRIHAAALAGLETTPDKKAAWAVVTHEMMEKFQARSEDIVGLVDQIRSINGVELAILFREEKDRVKVNFRSKDKVNVSQLAKNLGGGGHIRAAGAIINDSLDNVKRRVIAEVLKYLKATKYLV